MVGCVRASVAYPLLQRSLDRPKSRIPAGKDRSVADNFVQKQQKQRGFGKPPAPNAPDHGAGG